MLFSASLISALAVLPLALTASTHGPRRHTDSDVAERSHRSNHTSVEKRSFSGQATYFAVGQGACGQWSKSSDMMVALNTPQYGDGYPGPNCFKHIEITHNGKTVGATILDECPGCGWGSLDMSEGLFEQFEDLSVGVFPITWVFSDGSNSDSKPAPPPPPPKEKPKPKPTTHEAPPAPPPPPKTTSTKHSTTTHSTTMSTTTSKTTHSSTKKTTTLKKSTTPSASPSVAAGNNILNLNIAIISMINAAAYGAQGKELM